jgi:hypothetical protein
MGNQFERNMNYLKLGKDVKFCNISLISLSAFLCTKQDLNEYPLKKILTILILKVVLSDSCQAIHSRNKLRSLFSYSVKNSKCDHFLTKD